jgi:sugar O-acyltransferase (sialic acid O-acetyltransferase NeuD family)
MSRPLVIFGAGGQGRETLQIVRDINQIKIKWDVLGFLVDEQYLVHGPVHRVPLVGGISWLRDHPETSVVVAVGSSSARQRIVKRILSQTSNSFATLVHPLAWMGEGVDVADGSIISAGALLTTDIRVGRHVHINLGCTVGHDADIGDFATLSQRVSLAGGARIASGCELGTAAVVLPRVEIGEWSFLGAGTVATTNLPGNVTAVGAPARIVKTRPVGWAYRHPDQNP